MFSHLSAAVLTLTFLAPAAPPMTSDEIVAALRRPENSTGNRSGRIATRQAVLAKRPPSRTADAVEEATGARGWMSSDMKPIGKRNDRGPRLDGAAAAGAEERHSRT